MSAARCRFLLESAADLRSRLRAGGSELLIRRGHPEDVIPGLVAKLGGESAATRTTLYAHTDVCSEEADVHKAVKTALIGPTLDRGGDGGGGGGGGGGAAAGGAVSVKEVWGNALHLPSDLPFDFPSGLPEVGTQARCFVYHLENYVLVQKYSASEYTRQGVVFISSLVSVGVRGRRVDHIVIAISLIELPEAGGVRAKAASTLPCFFGCVLPLNQRSRSSGSSCVLCGISVPDRPSVYMLDAVAAVGLTKAAIAKTAAGFTPRLLVDVPSEASKCR